MHIEIDCEFVKKKKRGLQINFIRWVQVTLNVVIQSMERAKYLQSLHQALWKYEKVKASLYLQWT